MAQPGPKPKYRTKKPMEKVKTEGVVKVGPRPGYRFTEALLVKITEKGMSLAEISRQVGVSTGTMTRYASGQYTCREYIAEAIAKYIGFPLSEIAIAPT